MASLSPYELLKYDWRIQKFAQKYKDQEPFELNSGSLVKLKFDEKIYKTILSKKSAELQKIEFIDYKIKTRKYKLSNFKKTEEFGGKPNGAPGKAIEDREIQIINEQINALRGSLDEIELSAHFKKIKIKMEQIRSINEQLNEIRSKTGEKEVDIRSRTRIYKVAKCIKTQGIPKSDFTLVDKFGNEVMWISHKEGSSPRDFQQWGGMTEPEIANHPETRLFVQQIQEKFPDGLPNAMTIGKKIKDENLKKMSIYGVGYGSLNFGRQNVTLVLQGSVKIRRYGSIYIFSANHVYYNGDRAIGEYEPVFMAMYKGDRSNFGVKGARFAIQPFASRKVKEWIE